MVISQPPFQSTLVDANDRAQTPWAQWFSQLQPILQSVVASGPTSGRPTQNLYIGYPYFDTTIDQMMYWNGVIWVTYAPSTTGTSILKGNGLGGFNNAVAGVDFAPATSGTAILFGNGAGGFSSVAIGSGVTFAGGVLSATGSGGSVTDVTGTAPIASSGGTAPAISISQAGVSTNGYLSSIDWNIFNAKGTVTSISGTGTVNGITLTGTVTSSGSLTLGGTLGGIGNSQLTNSSITINGTATSLGGSISVGTVTGVTGSAPVVSSGGTAPAISMAAATTSINGYLTSTDWTTFNNKQPAGAYLTASTGVTTFAGNSTGLTPSAATSGAISLAGTLVVANGGTGLTTLATGYIPYGNGAGALSSSSTHTYNGTTLTAGNFVPSSATIATNGMYLPVANTLSFSTASISAITIDNVQGIGIGFSTGNGLKVLVYSDLGMAVSPVAGGAYKGALGVSVLGISTVTGTSSLARMYMTGSNSAHAGSMDLRSGSVIGSTLNMFNTSIVQTILIQAVGYSYFNAGGVAVGSTTDPGTGNISASGTVKTGGYTVATLPAGVVGARTYVTNALAPTFGAAVAGGGAITIPVFYNGAAWIVG